MAMHYYSTRGEGSEGGIGFDDVLTAGLAPDGGLFLPKTVPYFAPSELQAMSAEPYDRLALRLMEPYMAGSVLSGILPELTKAAYAEFQHPAIAPLVQIGPEDWVLELFHGPTLAFKDFAMQFLGQCLGAMLQRHAQPITVIGATSGDTGSAAIEACRHHPLAHCVILHPAGRVSEVQRRQMTTATEPNIHNIAIEGSFDDCQRIVKSLFADHGFAHQVRLTAVNSINWVRIMAQAVYYVYAALRLGAPFVAPFFVVPTGNFGNVFAGQLAKAMGLPISGLVVATNRNDILARLMQQGDYTPRAVQATSAPSMDIQVASNLERALLPALGGDHASLSQHMASVAEGRGFMLGASPLMHLQHDFMGCAANEEAISSTIRTSYHATGMLLDPHTATAVYASKKLGLSRHQPVIHLATAHPAKFPDAVKQATGVTPSLPPHMADLFERKETYTTLPADVLAVRKFIQDRVIL